MALAMMARSGRGAPAAVGLPGLPGLFGLLGLPGLFGAFDVSSDSPSAHRSRRIAPMAYTSTRASTRVGSPAACSGAMYPGVPSTTPWPVVGDADRAAPDSAPAIP